MKEEVFKESLVRIGTRLTELRKQKGYSSHEDFAYDYDLPRVQYWRMEKGKANITLKSLHKILSIHRISVEDFFCQLHKDGRK